MPESACRYDTRESASLSRLVNMHARARVSHRRHTVSQDVAPTRMPEAQEGTVFTHRAIRAG